MADRIPSFRPRSDIGTTQGGRVAPTPEFLRFLDQLTRQADAGALATLSGLQDVLTHAIGDVLVRSATGWEGKAFLYKHTQAVASDTWTINHNLDRHPVISVKDTAGREVIGDVEHPTANQAILTFSVPFAGTAMLR